MRYISTVLTFSVLLSCATLPEYDGKNSSAVIVIKVEIDSKVQGSKFFPYVALSDGAIKKLSSGLNFITVTAPGIVTVRPNFTFSGGPNSQMSNRAMTIRVEPGKVLIMPVKIRYSGYRSGAVFGGDNMTGKELEEISSQLEQDYSKKGYLALENGVLLTREEIDLQSQGEPLAE